MTTDELVKQLLERAEWIGKLDILDSRNTCTLMRAAAVKIEQLTPKYDPEIPVHVEELRDIAVRVGRLFSHRTEAVILAAADRIERMNGPKPKPTIGQLSGDIRSLANNTYFSEDDRERLEAAIKALKGEE